MTVAAPHAEETRRTVAATEFRENGLAPWHIRAGAFALDVLPAVAVAATAATAALTVSQHAVWWWVCVSVAVLAVLLALVNRLLLPAIFGWSLGRALCGIRVVRRPKPGEADAVGGWGLLLRDLAHLLDTASTVGWLWPLWDERRRTFADMLVRTEVRHADPDKVPPNMRRWTTVTVLAAAAVSLAGAAVSYAVVYSRERAAAETTAHIREQGPKIVAQMLTYDPKTLHDDFTRALSLATDNYRGKLAAQQGIVEKGTPVVNEYWVTDNSVESASPDRATMLLFMQGRRGVAPAERYISATVRVKFAKTGNDRWRVDDLDVVTKPKPPGTRTGVSK